MQDATQCPVCHMDVDPQSSPSENYRGKQYNFCSDGCREKFLQDPASYIGS
ncbi:YHS domain-containing protein [Tessaracoccus sp. HDW20]|uniref:YHS domain-containing protein n=1 Tax=Tessaracoccus coleopterorum TaxID=2714950 RepID=UPI0018D32C6D|nr:YHS domain-containing protein [Tessaracoccus coleopterorum]NHB85948.1 YHS domain-containing protein [Tessaracoccus coleopterorum]